MSFEQSVGVSLRVSFEQSVGVSLRVSFEQSVGVSLRVSFEQSVGVSLRVSFEQSVDTYQVQVDFIILFFWFGIWLKQSVWAYVISSILKKKNDMYISILIPSCWLNRIESTLRWLIKVRAGCPTLFHMLSCLPCSL